VGERIESDHMPLEVKIYGEEKSRRGAEEEKEIEKRVWSEETKEEYVRNCKGWSSKEEETERIWKEIKEKTEEAIPKVKKKRYKWKLGEREYGMIKNGRRERGD